MEVDADCATIVGVEEAKNLARTGAKVYFTSRDLTKGERVREKLLRELKAEGLNPEIDVIQMELTSLDSIRAAADEFKSKSDALHILVCNAGKSRLRAKIRLPLTMNN
jgi:NAD(P)-dependent dehydrogenase (short-subunit alcohol dehydrogenase family)